MSPEPDSPEFANLAMRWFDGLASDAEAVKLFESVRVSPGCARAFAEAARFERLLEQTSMQMVREGAVVQVATTQTRRYRRRVMVRRALQIAAALLLLGFVVQHWWSRPGVSRRSAVAGVGMPKAPEALPSQRPVRRVVATNVVMQSSTSANDPVVEKPLDATLEDFYLTSLHLDKVRLQDAVRMMKEQLRALNFSRRIELDRLLVSLPAEATEREITFHTGAISFLSALQAIAGLVDCEVQVSEQGIALSTHRSPGDRSIESRSVESLLAAHLGGTASVDALRAGLLTDARSLGLLAADETDLTSISGTQAQLDALALMLASRAKIAAMQDLRLVAFPKPGTGSTGARVLTESEAKQQRETAQRQGAPMQAIMLRPSSDELQPEHLDLNAPQTPDLILTARPAGENNWMISVVSSGATTVLGPSNQALTGEALDGFVGRRTGMVVPYQVNPFPPEPPTSTGPAPSPNLLAANTSGGKTVGTNFGTAGDLMTKAGSGALALNGTSTYMGASSVTSGTIAGVNFINAGSSFDSNSVSTVSSGQVRVMTGGGSTSFQLSASQMATFTSQVQAQVQIRGSGLSQAEMVLLLEQITSGN